MREIEFRGKSIMDNGYGEWLYSSGINYGDDVELMYCDEETSETWFYVDKETLGQYTGLKDKNGKKIFEGDIVLYEDCEMNTENGYGDAYINKGIIEYCNENACFNVTERETAELADVLYEGNDTLEVIRKYI